MDGKFDPSRLLYSLPLDLWLLVLKTFDLKGLCCLGATSRLARDAAFRADLEQWKDMRMPKCTAKKAISILRLGGSACKLFDCSAYSQISDDVLSFAALQCKNLTALNVSGGRKVQQGLLEVARSCPHLKSLRCSGCPRISDQEVQAVAQEMRSRLTTLDISSCSTRISDVAARAIGCCSHMRELRLLNAGKLTDWGVRDMLVRHRVEGQLGCGRSLRQLCLSSCEQLTDESLLAIAIACTSLQYLDLSFSSRFTSEGLARVLDGSSQLVSLDLIGVAKMGDAAMEHLPLQLRSLSIPACKVTDVGARHIASRCTALRMLDVAADAIGDEGGVALVGITTLRILNLNCTAISDSTLEALASQPRHSTDQHGLLSLKLRGCTQISTLGIVALAGRLASLIDLDMRDCCFSITARTFFPSLLTLNGKKRKGCAPKRGSLGGRGSPAGRGGELVCGEACSLSTSGASYCLQDFYHCATCSILGHQSICVVCAARCHAGHQIEYRGKGECYCDCSFVNPDLCCGRERPSAPPTGRRETPRAPLEQGFVDALS